MAVHNVPFSYVGESSRPLRVNNVSKRLRIPERTVRHLAKTKRLPAFKLDGKSWGFFAADIERYREQMEDADDF